MSAITYCAGQDCRRPQREGPKTDLQRWRLRVDNGRHVWEYTDRDSPDDNIDIIPTKYHLGLPTGITAIHPQKRTAKQGLDSALSFLEQIQASDGHWAGDYGGPMFLIPGLVIAMYITKTPLPESHSLELRRYINNMQIDDGGWGLHTACPSTMLGTVLNYVALRLLGHPRDAPMMEKAREWIRSRGGAVKIPTWGKFYLSILNVVSWDILNSLFPELAILPRWFPVHVWRIWCYARTVYMPMSLLYGKRFQAAVTPLILELRKDLLVEPFENIQWTKWQNVVADEDLYTPYTTILKVSNTVFNLYESVVKYCPWLRNWATDWLHQVNTKEDEFTNYIDIGPVSKAIHLVSVWLLDGPDSDAFKKHQSRIADYLWMGRDGMKMNGTNGSQLWDTAFVLQAVIQGPEEITKKYSRLIERAHSFVDNMQFRENHKDHERYYRNEVKGGWPFSTKEMGWIVADCTGEGLKATIVCKKLNLVSKPLQEQRFFDAVDILISYQNATGGYATCEPTRGWSWYECFNSSEVFGEIMIDYDYVECTSSALVALASFQKVYPNYRTKDVFRTVTKATQFLLNSQRADGSFEGMWGICFTYGTWFAVEGLVDAGLATTYGAVRKACEFVVSKQRDDGSWGESFMSCVSRTYVQHKEPQVVNTAWAVLTLLKGGHALEAARRGIAFLISQQLPNGDWPHEGVCGVFNKNCMIDYSNFKNIFPMWALARFTAMYPDDDMLVQCSELA